MHIWKTIDNIQEKELIYAKDDIELKTVKVGGKCNEKSKTREEEKVTEHKTLNARNTEIEMSGKKARLDDAEQTKWEGLMKAIHKEDFKNNRYSNHMKDAVRSYCQICNVPQTFTTMRSHAKSRHGISITDYKKKYGQLIKNIVEVIYHKCGICNKDILLDGDTLATHARFHGLTHKAYSEKYIILMTQDEKKKLVKMAINSVRHKEVSTTKVEDVMKEYPEKDHSPVERYKDLSAQDLADTLLEELNTLIKSYTVK